MTKIKKVIALLLMTCVLLKAVDTASAQDFFQEFQEKGYLDATGPSSFDQLVSRGEFVGLRLSAMVLEEAPFDLIFTDVEGGHAHAGAILRADQEGWIRLS